MCWLAKVLADQATATAQARPNIPTISHMTPRRVMSPSYRPNG